MLKVLTWPQRCFQKQFRVNVNYRYGVYIRHTQQRTLQLFLDCRNQQLEEHVERLGHHHKQEMAISSYIGPQTLPINVLTYYVLISFSHSCRTPWAHIILLPGSSVEHFLDLCDVRQTLGQLLGHISKFYKGLRVH